MKTTPANISEHPDGYLVRIVRGDLKWTAFVPYSHPDALNRAIKLRDRFYKVCGPAKVRGLSKAAHSNTGIIGVSQTVHRRRGRELNCFIATTRGHNKRFYFGWRVPRSTALQRAVAHRLQATGQSTAQPSFIL